MTTAKQRLDPAFLDKQQRRLTQLRTQLLGVRRDQDDEQVALTDANSQAREYEDDGQKLATLELQGNLAKVDDERLRNIERALQKIDDGTYGLSDLTGTPIPIERLQASPEAILTVAEQEARDAAR